MSLVKFGSKFIESSAVVSLEDAGNPAHPTHTVVGLCNGQYLTVAGAIEDVAQRIKAASILDARSRISDMVPEPC